jgi:hypothetical protein
MVVPALPYTHICCAGQESTSPWLPASFPYPLAIVGKPPVIGVLGATISLTVAASVTFASWVYGSPSRLARVPTELDLLPASRGLSCELWVG